MGALPDFIISPLFSRPHAGMATETGKVAIAHGCIEFPLHECEMDRYLRSA